MSHRCEINTQINNLAALKAACGELGFTLVEGVKTYNQYYKTEPCDHVIRCKDWTGGMKGTLEVGVIRDGKNYRLGFDDMLQDWYQNKNTSLGDKAGRLLQLYGVHTALLQAKKYGYRASRVIGKSGNIEVHMTASTW